MVCTVLNFNILSRSKVASWKLRVQDFVVCCQGGGGGGGGELLASVTGHVPLVS